MKRKRSNETGSRPDFFEPPTKISKQAKWTFNTEKHYKIWFSKNPVEFLDLENKLIFIEAMRLNSNAKFSFVYSSKCLNEKSLQELYKFCAEYNIQPVDFDKDISQWLVDDNEKQLYELAQKEIAYTLSNEGGNLAAASDIVRLMIPVIERCGIYSDFDVDIDFSKHPDQIEHDSPIIFSVSEPENSVSICNNFMAVAIDSNQPCCICHKAKKMIGNVQSHLIDNYRNPMKAFESPESSESLGMIEKNALIAYFKKYPASTIFEFRKFVEELDCLKMLDYLDEKIYRVWFSGNRGELTDCEVKNRLLTIIKVYLFPSKESSNQDFFFKKFEGPIKHNLISSSVINMSGPNILCSLFKRKDMDGKTFLEKSRANFDLLHKCDAEKYLGQNIEKARENNHFSWTENGEYKKKKRIGKMLEAGKKITSAWKVYREYKNDNKDLKPEENGGRSYKIEKPC